MKKVLVCIDSNERFDFFEKQNEIIEEMKQNCFVDENISSIICEKIFKNKFCFLQLPSNEHCFIYLDCILENNNIYYKDQFVVSFTDIKNYILDSNTNRDFGHIFVESLDTKMDNKEDLHESYTNCIWHKNEIYFDNVKITDADVSFYIHKN